MKKLIGVCVLTAAAWAADTTTIPSGKNVRVFIAESDSWEMQGRHGGARNQTPELIKTFSQKCGDAITITNNKDKADYIVTFSHEGGKGYARKDNKIAVFNKDGDMIFTDSTRSLGGAVEGACRKIQ